MQPINSDKRKYAFRRKLKKKRKTLKLNQTKMAMILGVKAQRISEWERGIRLPKRLTQIGIFTLLWEYECTKYECTE